MMRRTIGGRGLRRQATTAEAAGGARRQHRVWRTPGYSRLAPPSVGLPARGGARRGKVAAPGRMEPGGARPETHLSRVGRRTDSALHSGRVAAVPDRSRVQSLSYGPPKSDGDRPGPGLEGPQGGAPAHATPLAPGSLLRSQYRSLSRPPRARGCEERPGDPGPPAEGARGAAKAGIECRPPRALAAPALRSGTELGGAQRALFPRFPKGHPGGGAP